MRLERSLRVCYAVSSVVVTGLPFDEMRNRSARARGFRSALVDEFSPAEISAGTLIMRPDIERGEDISAMLHPVTFAVIGFFSL